MLGLFDWGTTAAPAAVTGDRILPLHFFDDTPVWRSFILYSLFVLEDPLDTDKIRYSLEGLAQKEGWQKLGARLQRNVHARALWSITLPLISTKTGRPSRALMFNDTPIADRPAASQILKPSTRPAILGDPDQFLSLMHPEGSPKKLEDYVNSERPQLGLHTVSFNDATLVSIYWPHIMFDTMAKKALLTVWSLTLQGRQDEILPLCGADSDPLTELGRHPTEVHKLADRQLSTLELVRDGINHITEFALRGNETRVVCIPAAFMDKLRDEALRDVSVDSSSDEDTFLSEGDILCAWWTCVAISHLSPDSDTNFVLYNAYSLRNVLAGDLLPANTSYLSNATGFIHVPLTVKEIFTKPLGYIASRIRYSSLEYGTRNQAEAFMSMVRHSPARTPPFFGDPSMHMVTYSNWSKSKMFETDFSAAIKSESPPASEGHVLGRPTYIRNCQYGLTLPNAFPIMGKDSHGNYWLSGYLNKGNWDRINEMFADL